MRPSLVTVLAAALLTGGWVQAQEIALNPEQRSAFGIELAALKPLEEGPRSGRLPARVTVPNQQLQVVSARQPGVIEKLLVATGDRVNEGDTLLQLRSPELLQLQRDYLQARARNNLTYQSYTRDQKLRDEGIIAERRLEQSRSEYLEAAATLDQSRQALLHAGMSEVAIDRLERTRELDNSLMVTAPLAGVVLEEMVTAGEQVEAAAPLYRIGQLSPLWLEIHTPLSVAQKTQTGRNVFLPSVGLEATIITIGSQVHGADQGVQVRAELTEGTERVRPGQFVEAQLELAGSYEGAYRVPRTGLIREAGTAYLFVETEGGFEPVEAEVVSEERNSLIVRLDVAAGTRVAVSGTAALKGYWREIRAAGD